MDEDKLALILVGMLMLFTLLFTIGVLVAAGLGVKC
jgi:hypothetical protein